MFVFAGAAKGRLQDLLDGVRGVRRDLSLTPQFERKKLECDPRWWGQKRRREGNDDVDEEEGGMMMMMRKKRRK